MSGYRPT